MEDRNGKNACQMIDGKSEHSHNPYLLPSISNLFASLNKIASNESQQADPVATRAIANPQFLQYTQTCIDLSTNEQGGSYEVSDNHRVAYKRKHSEVATGDCYLPANPCSSSSSSRQLQHEEPNENGYNVMTRTTFTYAEYFKNVEAQTEVAQHGSERNSLQQQPEFSYNNYIGQPFQPSSSGSVQQHGNYSRGGGFCNGNYTNPLSCVNGIYSESGAQESMNAHMQENETAWPHGNFAFGLPFPNQNQHLPSVQSMQVLSQNQNVQTVAPAYFCPVSNLQATDAHPSLSDENSGNRSQIVQVASIAPPYLLSVSSVQTINAHLSLEDEDQASRLPSVQVHSNQNIQTVAPSHRPVSDLETSNAHPFDSANRSPGPSQLIAEVVYLFHQPEAEEEYEDDEESYYDSDSDLHGDMLLNIEDLSYEELLALVEQMGDANTGLSEDSILKNLKTSVCAPLSLTLSHSSVSLLNERCAVCLVEYEEDERIGSLDCGHCYHADCIKEWLLIKNVCPMCRTCALASGRKE